MRAIAARALAEPDPLDPSGLLGRTEREEEVGLQRIPEDVLEEALAAYMGIKVNGVDFGVRQIVSCCAEINRMLEPGAERYVIHGVVLDAAEVIDGAGFAGGARASLTRPIDHLLAELASIPAELGRFARGAASEGASYAPYWPACAMRTGLIALWVREHESFANRAA